ncbi:MAG: hypothetical protein HY368_00210 [Candidatus Aenigmarchaeota archaeon]|nr:hypothetical protein [Candidatus Aenigmarchaeota archaeon]
MSEGVGVERKIITLLDKRLLSTSQIAKKLRMRREVATGYLEALVHQGKIKKEKVGRSNIYTIYR